MQGFLYGSDSPLGEGWTSHYGVLWTAPPHGYRPQYIDNSGARHQFHLHNILDNAIPITSAGSYPTFISTQLEILRCTSENPMQWELLAPNGLRIIFEKLPQYAFLVSTRICDAFGNSTVITYVRTELEADDSFYFEHPLPSTVTDGDGRSLTFHYIEKAGKKRISNIQFEDRILSRYTYDIADPSAPSGTGSSSSGSGSGSSGSGSASSGAVIGGSASGSASGGSSAGHVPGGSGSGSSGSGSGSGGSGSATDRAYLRTHETGAGRVTIYTVDTSQAPAFGTIKAIRAPTGGLTEFWYENRSVFYRPGDMPTVLYMVTKIERGGDVWTYLYQNSIEPSTPLPNPTGNDFVVRVTANATEFIGDYTYHTYGPQTTIDGSLWKVGLLLHSNETVGGESEILTYEYESMQVATDYGPDLAYPQVSTPRLTRSTIRQDGFDLVTTYSDFDVYNQAREVDRPGNIHEVIGYQHVAQGTGNPPILMLGIERSREITISNMLIERTVKTFDPGAVLPSSVRFYRTPTTYVDVALTYFTDNGKAGSLESKTIGDYIEQYDYQNGVPSLLEYPLGPNLHRTIDANGTIQSETRAGVTRDYDYDDEFRPITIYNPGADFDTTNDYENDHCDGNNRAK